RAKAGSTRLRERTRSTRFGSGELTRILPALSSLNPIISYLPALRSGDSVANPAAARSLPGRDHRECRPLVLLEFEIQGGLPERAIEPISADAKHNLLCS